MSAITSIGRPKTAHDYAIRQMVGTIGKYVLVYGLGLAFVLFSTLPLIWGISTALKVPSEVYAFPPSWIPTTLTFENFFLVVQNKNLLRAFLNTLIIASGTTFIALVVGVLGGYGFARYHFPGRNMLLWSVLFTKLFPRVVVIVPFFITLRNLQMMNSYQGLILVYLMVTFPVAIWLLKGFFDKIPVEIEEAAVIDGCNLPQLLWYVILPMSRPAMIAVAMYSFILAWNEFLFALVFTNGLERRPLSIALAFFIDENGIRWGELMAASVVMSLPAIIVFSFAQKLLVRGLSDGAVKG
ncbi:MULTISPECIES: carbohydrate ABC transporter permease [unclassified Chelatococcus]|uniref:carbohydrate ABC transporter permease n=1 Tax=unclassified Chelatococcus TaxID=2638111 RepID=UPI001BD1264B|nr:MULTISPECIES: carbohydrate ABC transporter permease [unclassified Chelatococcus]MBS7700759.1 carbohydrate ABC transporter permease [Chelatococcus sp. YT9]MBX3559343.1 carbohydrate ABC transporter permease [Chelatococcus sp.]